MGFKQSPGTAPSPAAEMHGQVQPNIHRRLSYSLLQEHPAWVCNLKDLKILLENIFHFCFLDLRWRGVMSASPFTSLEDSNQQFCRLCTTLNLIPSGYHMNILPDIQVYSAATLLLSFTFRLPSWQRASGDSKMCFHHRIPMVPNFPTLRLNCSNWRRSLLMSPAPKPAEVRSCGEADWQRQTWFP